jgi:cytochrome P450 family 6
VIFSVVFFFAGSDTSSNTVAFAIMELSQNPEIQEKLRREILEKTKTSNGQITYENLHEMSYLSQVVNGTF